MISDVTGMEVVVSAGNEFGAKGVAMMVGLAVGEYESYTCLLYTSPLFLFFKFIIKKKREKSYLFMLKVC